MGVDRLEGRINFMFSENNVHFRSNGAIVPSTYVGSASYEFLSLLAVLLGLIVLASGSNMYLCDSLSSSGALLKPSQKDLNLILHETGFECLCCCYIETYLKNNGKARSLIYIKCQMRDTNLFFSMYVHALGTNA